MARKSTIKKKIKKKIKNKEKTSVKYIALPATLPSGLKYNKNSHRNLGRGRIALVVIAANNAIPVQHSKQKNSKLLLRFSNFLVTANLVLVTNYNSILADGKRFH